MSLITLTTDMGTAGFYVASVKAAILKGLPTATIVDVTHSIKPFHITSAAFIVKNVFKQFPEGTIHIVAVDALNSPHSRVIAVQSEGHFFVGPDNGLFSLVFDHTPPELYEVTIAPNHSSLSFIAKDVMAKTAVHLANGGKIEEIGVPLKSFIQLTAWQPIYNENSIRTSVVYIDEYGNCMFNLDKMLFEQTAKNRKFTIDVKRNDINTISGTYNDVAGGELVAIFSGSGLLEIAINRGNLSELLGMKEGDSVVISFE